MREISGPDEGWKPRKWAMGERTERRFRHSSHPKAGIKGHRHDTGSWPKYEVKKFQNSSILFLKYTYRLYTERARQKVQADFLWRILTSYRVTFWKGSSTGLPGLPLQFIAMESKCSIGFKFEDVAGPPKRPTLQC